MATDLPVPECGTWPPTASPSCSFGGNIDVSAAVGLGFKTIGPQGTVTVADDSSIQQIDGRPATEFLHRYMDATGPAAYAILPLAVLEEDAKEHYLRVIPAFRPLTPASYPPDCRIGFRSGGTCAAHDSGHRGGPRGNAGRSRTRARAAFPGGHRPDAAGDLLSRAVRKILLGSRTHIEAELLARSVLGDVRPSESTATAKSPRFEAHRGQVLNETFVSLLLGG